jgi:hypothetical protein
MPLIENSSICIQFCPRDARLVNFTSRLIAVSGVSV